MQLYKISDLATTNSQLAINLENIERKDEVHFTGCIVHDCNRTKIFQKIALYQVSLRL